MKSQIPSFHRSPSKRSFIENTPQKDFYENPQATSTILHNFLGNSTGHNVKQDGLFVSQNTHFNQSMEQKKEIRKIKKEQKNFQMLQKLSSLPKRLLRSQKNCNDFEENQEDKSNKDSPQYNHLINNQILDGRQQNDGEFSVKNINQQEQQQQNYIQEYQFQSQQKSIQDDSMNSNSSFRNNQMNVGVNKNNQINYQQNEQKRGFDNIFAEKNSGYQSSFNQSSSLSYDFHEMEQNDHKQANNFQINFEESSQKILFQNINMSEELFNQYSQNNNYEFGIQNEDDFQKILDSNNSNRFECEQEKISENCQQTFIQADQNINQQSEQVQMNQNYEKSENNSIQFQKNNVVKNLMSSFKRFILKLFRVESTKVESKDFSGNQSSEKKEIIEIYFKKNTQIDELLIQTTRKIVLNLYNKNLNHKQCFCEKMFLKRFEKYFKNKSFNQHSLNLLLIQSSFSQVFKYFLKNFATNWLINSSITNYDSYQIMIQFLTKK